MYVFMYVCVSVWQQPYYYAGSMVYDPGDWNDPMVFSGYSVEYVNIAWCVRHIGLHVC